MPAEGRGLSSEPTPKVGKDRRLGNLATPTSVQRLQTALHAKAKEEPEFRFHALYDKIYRTDVLKYAYACCRANNPAKLPRSRFRDGEPSGLFATWTAVKCVSLVPMRIALVAAGIAISSSRAAFKLHLSDFSINPMVGERARNVKPM